MTRDVIAVVSMLRRGDVWAFQLQRSQIRGSYHDLANYIEVHRSYDKAHSQLEILLKQKRRGYILMQ